MSKRKIAVVTGSRADYGLLYWIMKEIDNDPSFDLCVIATGMHLSHEFGYTYRLIEEDGFRVDYKIETLVSSDTSTGIAKSIGLGVIGFADVLFRLQPDLLLVLGDRYEIFAAVQAALVAKVPVAHIAGGDLTEGSYDDALRHSITKMSHIHFVTNEPARKRVIQLGENPNYVINVGSPGVEYIRKFKRKNRQTLEKELGFSFRKKNLLITFHPVTLDNTPSEVQLRELLNALDRLGREVGLIFTKPNADNSGRKMAQILTDYIEKKENAVLFTSMGQDLYLSTMANVDAVVGNSSSGLYEAPSFQIPTINIGDRQKGRLMGESVINAEVKEEEIYRAIMKGFEMNWSNIINPYGKGETSKEVLSILKSIPDFSILIKKNFFEV